ncbi:MAG: Hsp70 family protein [Bryobacteraceae bacterium]
MKLGIDFGTTRVVIAAADRGNYPLVSFDAPDGSSADWYPSLVAVRGEERRYGWNAWAAQSEEGWTIVRSIKRLLESAGPKAVVDLGERQVSLQEMLYGLTSDLKSALRERSNLGVKADEPLQMVLGVPAHANSNQRFLTVEAFRSAGFEVLGVLNEPSAASIEFGHRERAGKGERESMLVYDLGGGTFDASLVALDDNVHHVLASEGIPSIGGDEFDQILADLALDAAGISARERDQITAGAWFRLLDECRTKKESLNPNSRRIVIELEGVDPRWTTVQVLVADFYAAARPLVDETVNATEDLLAHHKQGQFDILYLTGGGSELPLIARILREQFGRRVRRSAYTRSATAIGLGIQADRPERYRLSEQLSRYFGVWREADGGLRIAFDPLFSKGLQLPPTGDPPLSIARRYSPVHNIGHFRFLECSHRAADGTPSGEVTLWDEIRFPFDPALAKFDGLERQPVAISRPAASQSIAERYECDSSGSISVTVENETAGYSRVYRLGHWSQDEKPVSPVRRRGKTGKTSAHSA